MIFQNPLNPNISLLEKSIQKEVEYQDIFNRFLDYLKNKVPQLDKIQKGSHLWEHIEMISFLLYEYIHLRIEKLEKNLYIQTASPDALDLYAKDLKIQRIHADYAYAEIQLGFLKTLKKKIVVPEGTRISDPFLNLNFFTQESVIFEAPQLLDAQESLLTKEDSKNKAAEKTKEDFFFKSIKIRSEKKGSIYKKAQLREIHLPYDEETYIDSSYQIESGSDLEDIESYRNRILESFQSIVVFHSKEWFQKELQRFSMIKRSFIQRSQASISIYIETDSEYLKSDPGLNLLSQKIKSYFNSKKNHELLDYDIFVYPIEYKNVIFHINLEPKENLDEAQKQSLEASLKKKVEKFLEEREIGETFYLEKMLYYLMKTPEIDFAYFKNFQTRKKIQVSFKALPKLEQIFFYWDPVDELSEKKLL